ncbi:MAG: hypothetical protein RR337_06470 [Clostridia bacterium]
MGLFDSADEKRRKENLRILEDKRMAFAQKAKAAGLVSEKALYGQTGGGFHGIVVSGGQYTYVTGPAPGEDADFTMAKYPSVKVALEDVHIASEGMGGMLGFGKKGGLGFKLLLTFPDGSEGVIDVIAGQNCVYENERGVDPLFDIKRRRGGSNFVWEFRPIEQSSVNPIKVRWLRLLGDEI